MLEPNGPLPPEIYWRRRAFAFGTLALALALIIWLVLTVARSGGSPNDAEAAAAATSSSLSTTAAAASPDKPSDAAEPTKDPADTSTAPSGAPAASSPCADQSLAVKVTVQQPTYPVGEQPVFGIVITNISSKPCSRDMGSGLQQVSVQSLDGQRRIWSSTDCYPDGEPDERSLNPGEQAAFTVTWSGSTSQPDCAGERIQVPPGAYAVVAQLGSVRSAAEPFNIA